PARERQRRGRETTASRRMTCTAARSLSPPSANWVLTSSLPSSTRRRWQSWALVVFSRLVRHDGEIVERQLLYLNLSFDHRALDGAPAARYLREVKRLLELPASLLV